MPTVRQLSQFLGKDPPIGLGHLHHHLHLKLYKLMCIHYPLELIFFCEIKRN